MEIKELIEQLEIDIDKCVDEYTGGFGDDVYNDIWKEFWTKFTVLASNEGEKKDG